MVGQKKEVDASSWAADEGHHKPLGEAAHTHLITPSLVESGSLRHYSGEEAAQWKRWLLCYPDSMTD